MIKLKLKDKEFDLYGRRIFSGDKFIGWVTVYKINRLNPMHYNLSVSLARIDLKTVCNAEHYKFKGKEALDLIEELLSDEISDLEFDCLHSKLSFPHREKTFKPKTLEEMEYLKRKNIDKFSEDVRIRRNMTFL